ncbi:hypothetical protein [Dolichospermum circinale]|nr:hypothetical protein [Dolichospermum circinale]MDB9462322.1 hypothetical protein [Dolichospermum circinale CS-541/04]MDB9549082.1 hypothetical protein [Dolichospermum circinale CS-1031]
MSARKVLLQASRISTAERGYIEGWQQMWFLYLTQATTVFRLLQIQ